MRRTLWPVIAVLLLAAPAAASDGERAVFQALLEARATAKPRTARAIDDAIATMPHEQATLTDRLDAQVSLWRRAGRKLKADTEVSARLAELIGTEGGLKQQVDEYGLPPTSVLSDLPPEEALRGARRYARALVKSARRRARFARAAARDDIGKQLRELRLLHRDQTRLRARLGVAPPMRADEPDHDGNGIPDRLDPYTYTFDDDALGEAPAETTQLGRQAPSLTVRELGNGHRGIAYGDHPNLVSYDRFDRLRADRLRQHQTIYLDVGSESAVLSIELWSDGSWWELAGGGLIFQIDAAGALGLYLRTPSIQPAEFRGTLPESRRIRLRLGKLDDSASSLHVDGWVDDTWKPDIAVFDIPDDTRFTGIDTTICEYRIGKRSLERITVVPAFPDTALTLSEVAPYCRDWQVFQRDADDVASIPVRALVRTEQVTRLQARVVDVLTSKALAGHDWSDHQRFLLPCPDGERVTLALAGVPAGGNYHIEVRLLAGPEGTEHLGSDGVANVAVGDIVLAAGQSNMTGLGPLIDVEQPRDDVHLFHNDGAWTFGSEPMDSSVGQRDLISNDNPRHSAMLAFGKALADRTHVPVGIIPGPRSGTNLYAQWLRDDVSPAMRRTLYGSLLSRAREVIGDGPPPLAMLWMQGESDAIADRTIEQYRDDLNALIANYREDLEAPQMRVLIGQLGTWTGSLTRPTWIGVQEAQRQVALGDPLAFLASTVDLPRSDGIHFSSVGQQVLGLRWAEALSESLFDTALDPLTELLDAHRSPDGTQVVLTYEAPVTGGDATLFAVTDGAGEVEVTLVAPDGTQVTLTLDRPIAGDSLVRYGLSTDPFAPWLKDERGVAVPCFGDVPIR